MDFNFIPVHNRDKGNPLHSPPQPHTNLKRRTFDLAVKGQRSTYDHLNKVGRARVLDAIYQDSAPKLSWFWRKFFKSLPYMDTADILFNSPEPFEQIGNTLSTEGPCEIWWNLLKQFLYIN